MRYFILALLLTGCSSLESNVKTMYQIDTMYCNGDGFKAYSEIGNAVILTCKDGTRGRFEL